MVYGQNFTIPSNHLSLITLTLQNDTINATIWERLYSSGRDLNYPSDFFVTTVNHTLDPAKEQQVLDYGVGTGANLIFLHQRGFNCSGVEVSTSAMQATINKFKRQGVTGDLKLMPPNGPIPFANDSFDAVVAWQVLYYNTYTSFQNAMTEIRRVLRPGGKFIGTMVAEDDISCTTGESLGNNLYRSQIADQKERYYLV